MRKSLGSKRKEMSEEHITAVTRLFGAFVETVPDPPAGGKVKLAPLSRIFPNEAFGYRAITVERPLRDEHGEIVLGTKGKQKGRPQSDASLRDTENVPLSEDVGAYFRREVLPHAPDAWIDEEKTKISYEIPFNRHFYVFEPPRSLDEIDTDLEQVTARIKAMIEGLAA
jgi:type I restriction enzyme M protein